MEARQRHLIFRIEPVTNGPPCELPAIDEDVEIEYQDYNRRWRCDSGHASGRGDTEAGAVLDWLAQRLGVEE